MHFKLTKNHKKKLLEAHKTNSNATIHIASDKICKGENKYYLDQNQIDLSLVFAELINRFIFFR